jgi:hypothetical protein
MPSKNLKRFGLALKPEHKERLDAVTATHGCSQSELMAATVTVLSDAEIASMLERYRKTRAIEKELRKTADQRLLAFLKGKSPEDLEKMLQAAQKAG